MAEWWQVWMGRLEPVEVDRSTEKSVWIKDRRQDRDGWQRFFPTWKEAHAYMLKEAELRVQTARLSLERANGHLGNVKGMKRPSTAGAGN